MVKLKVGYKFVIGLLFQSLTSAPLLLKGEIRPLPLNCV